MPLQQPSADRREDVVFELGLRSSGGDRGVSVRFDGKTAILCLRCRHHRPARQLPEAMSGRPNWHTAELPNAAEYSACSGPDDVPGRSDRDATELCRCAADLSCRSNRHAAELQARGPDDVSGWNDGHATELCRRTADLSCGSNRHAAKLQGGHGAADVSGWNDGHATELRRRTADLSCGSNRYAAELQGGHGATDMSCRHDGDAAKLQGKSAADMSCRYNGDAAELQGKSAADMSCRHDGDAAELQGEPAADMSCRYDGHATELQGQSAADMSCRYDGHAAELQGKSAADMSCRYDGHATKLQGESAAEMSCRYDGHATELQGEPAADMPCRHNGDATELQGAAAASAAEACACTAAAEAGRATSGMRASEEAQPCGPVRVTQVEPERLTPLRFPFKLAGRERMMSKTIFNACSLTLIASTTVFWAASSKMANAQSRLFSCPHARIIELTVKGPDSISADRDVGKPVILKRDPGNPLRFVSGKYAVTLTPDQGALTLDAPDWGSTKCLFGSLDVKPFIP
jgi:hypothetical protein